MNEPFTIHVAPKRDGTCVASISELGCTANGEDVLDAITAVCQNAELKVGGSEAAMQQAHDELYFLENRIYSTAVRVIRLVSARAPREVIDSEYAALGKRINEFFE